MQNLSCQAKPLLSTPKRLSNMAAAMPDSIEYPDHRPLRRPRIDYHFDFARI